MDPLKHYQMYVNYYASLSSGRELPLSSDDISIHDAITIAIAAEHATGNIALHSFTDFKDAYYLIANFNEN